MSAYPTDLYPGCPCFRCDSATWPELRPGFKLTARMSLCPTCGNKRCPGAADHTRHPSPSVGRTATQTPRLSRLVAASALIVMNLTCPECGNDEQGRFMGHEYRGVYDGVLVWQCLACGHAWPRDFGPGHEERHAAARGVAVALTTGFRQRASERGDT